MRPVNVNPLCHPPVGAVLLELAAYSTVCPLAGADAAFIVMLELVALASVGVATVAPGAFSVVTVRADDAVPALYLSSSADLAKTW